MKNASKRIMAMLLVLTMVLGLVPSVFAADMPFTDVPETEWYAEYVQFVYENRYMIGTDSTVFEPQAGCTRAMAATVLWRVNGECPVSGPSSFTDLTQDWYANAVAWAERTGVVNGIGDGLFAPDRLVTREELVTMAWRMAGEPAARGDATTFPDHADISEYAQTAFAWAIGKGIINGSDGKLLPTETATRAQFAKIIATYVEAMKPCAEHKWDEGVVTTEPTCTEGGVKTYTCVNCDATNEEALPAIGHIYVDGVCTNCGEKLAEEDELVILFTNDVHTYIDGALSYDNIADLKAQLVKVAGGVALVDAGDHIQGTAYGSMDKGNSIIEMMNAAGYDLATLGNHEFDYGMARALEIVEQADFEYVSANFYHEANGVRGENVLNASAILEIGGKKIAFIGITTPESFTKSTPKYFMDEAGNYIYGIAGGEDGAALYADVQAAIDAVKDEADYIIALGHLGDDASSQPWTSAEVIANVSGLDAFIDGHSHSTVVGELVKDKDGNDVVLAQTGEYFNAIGRMSIKGEEIAVELITEHTGSDATTKEIKDAWIAEVDEILGEVIGHAEVTLDNYDANGRLVRKQETNTGDFAADALYYLFNVTEGLEVDAAIMNGGGVRNKAITGDMSYKTCKDIHTFGNVACLITVTGQQILDALEWGARDVGTAECGGFLQVSGITYEIHSYIESTVQMDDKAVWTGGPTGEYRVKNVTIGGEALDVNASYNLAGYNYTLRDLGDGFAMFNGAVNVKDYVMEDYMVLANYLKSFPVDETSGLPTITAENSVYGDVYGAGRITVVAEKPVDPDLPTYTLTTELKDGDQVIIVNAANNIALGGEYGGSYYNPGVTVAPADGKIVTEDTTIVWTVGKDGDNYTFSYNGKKIAMGASYSSMPLGEVNDTWTISAAPTTENAFFIMNVGRQLYMEWYAANQYWSGYGNTSDEALFAHQFYVLRDDVTPPHNHEWDEGTVTTEPTCTEAGVKTYTCTTCGETKTEAIEATGHNFVDGACGFCGIPAPTTKYELVSELKAGDQIIIYNPGHGKAIKNETDRDWYLIAQEVTVTDNSILTADTTIVWTVVVNEDGTYSFINGDNAITAWLSGNYIELTNNASYAGGDTKWNITASATENMFYISSSSIATSYGPGHIECYTKSDGDKIAGYASTSPSDNDYGFQFYALTVEDDDNGDEPCNHTWNEGTVTTEPTCSEAGVKTLTCTICGEIKTQSVPAIGHSYDEGTVTTEPTCTAAGEKTFTCGTCGETKTETVPTIPHNYVDGVCTICDGEEPAPGNFVVATDVKDGDKIVIVAQYEGSYYAVANDNATVSNALYGAAVSVNDGVLDIGTADVIWEVCGGTTEGSFFLKSSAGKYLFWAGSGTAVSLKDEGSEWNITCGEGTSVVAAAGDATRMITYRNATTGPQFRCYKDSNVTNPEYSFVITIYKQA